MRVNHKYLVPIAAVSLLAAGSGEAVAQDEVLFDFAFNSMSSSYDAGSSFFSSMAVAGDELDTSGNVRRLAEPQGTARYSPGFASDGGSLADVVVTMDIAELQTASTVGTGTLLVSDDDGDLLSADISGRWEESGLGLFFNGSMTNVMFTDTDGLDGTFDGPDGGSFSYDEDGGPFEGALVLLQLSDGDVDFDDSFADVAADVSGQVVPTPGTLALAGIGLGLWGTSGRRRRRRSD